MQGFLLTWLLATVSLLITAYLVPGVIIESIPAAAVAAIVMGLVNAIVKPIITLLTLPLTILTLGLFLLVVNGISLSWDFLLQE
jgi:putative membrane protein